MIAGGELVATVGGVDVTADGLVTATHAATQGTVVTERVAGASRAGLFLLAWEAPGLGWQVTRCRPTRPT